MKVKPAEGIEIDGSCSWQGPSIINKRSVGGKTKHDNCTGICSL